MIGSTKSTEEESPTGYLSPEQDDKLLNLSNTSLSFIHLTFHLIVYPE